MVHPSGWVQLLHHHFVKGICSAASQHDTGCFLAGHAQSPPNGTSKPTWAWWQPGAGAQRGGHRGMVAAMPGGLPALEQGTGGAAGESWRSLWLECPYLMSTHQCFGNKGHVQCKALLSLPRCAPGWEHPVCPSGCAASLGSTAFSLALTAKSSPTGKGRESSTCTSTMGSWSRQKQPT